MYFDVGNPVEGEVDFELIVFATLPAEFNNRPETTITGTWYIALHQPSYK